MPLKTPSVQITEQEALAVAHIMAEQKLHLGDLIKVSETEYRTPIVNNLSFWIQTPGDDRNKYDRFAFKPVSAEKGPIPDDAYRCGYTLHDRNEDRLIGYIWSPQKARSLSREFKNARIPDHPEL